MIIAHNTHGLCNRIKNYVGARLRDDEVRIRWEKADSILCDFNDLFENDITTKQRIPRLEYNKCDFYTPGNKVDIGSFTWREIKNYGKKYPNKTARKRIVAILKELIPVEYVRAETEWESMVFDKNTVSVHIRSWGDNSPNKKDCWKEGINGFHIEHFINEMRKHINCMFFVASDNDKYIDILKEEFPKRIWYREKRVCKPGGKQFMQDALIDLYSLAKNSILIGSRKSTFSEVAWYLSGCKATPIILGGKLRLQ